MQVTFTKITNPLLPKFDKLSFYGRIVVILPTIVQREVINHCQTHQRGTMC
jgi:hypothetical protein